MPDRSPLRSAALLPAFALCLVAAACQQTKAPSPASGGGGGKSAALRNMEQVAISAHRCWFASKDPAFAGYSFANELNSFSGRPRFLLVPKNNYGGRPLLVVQASGGAGRVETFGPLMEGALAARISGDVSRWTLGSDGCGTGA